MRLVMGAMAGPGHTEPCARQTLTAGLSQAPAAAGPSPLAEIAPARKHTRRRCGRFRRAGFGVTFGRGLMAAAAVRAWDRSRIAGLKCAICLSVSGGVSCPSRDQNTG